MTVAADPWAPVLHAAPTTRRRGGSLVVWRIELAKLGRQVRVRIVAALCVVAPFVVVAGLHVQSSTPQDTLFGRWAHTSGFAVPLVVLGFAGQWVLPVLVAIVAGDIFSAEDHFGTWKTVMTRSRTRGQLFVGKVAAALTYALATVLLLALASVAAGAASGTQPIVGLGGQLVPAGHATALTLASWATQLAPVCGYVALAVAVSVAARSSTVGMGVPVVAGLLMQLATLVDLPVPVRDVLLSTPFSSWHGFWVLRPFYGPLRQGLLTSAVWVVVGLLVAWVGFRRRSVAAS